MFNAVKLLSLSGSFQRLFAPQHAPLWPHGVRRWCSTDVAGTTPAKYHATWQACHP